MKEHSSYKFASDSNSWRAISKASCKPLASTHVLIGVEVGYRGMLVRKFVSSF